MAAMLTLGLAAGCSRDEAAPPSSAAPAMAAPVAAAQPPAAAAPAGQARVKIDTDQGSFWFQPRRCMVGPDADTGVVSYRIEGAGQSPGGLPVYVTLVDEDGDPGQGPELRINVGTDQPMRTPEVVWLANDAASAGLQVPATRAVVQGQQVTLEGLVLTRDGTDRLVVQGPVRVDCAQPPRR